MADVTEPGPDERVTASDQEVVATTQEHAPAIQSPLNPAPPRPTSRTPVPPPIQREKRETKETLKKRESNLSNARDTPNAPTTLGKRKAHAQHAMPSPQRYQLHPPKAQDFEMPKDDVMLSHEPYPLTMPDSERQFYKPIDAPENKKHYRYTRAIADPEFPHKQFFRSTSPPPHYSRMSFEDADKWMHFTTNALLMTNEKGWRMARANVCAREGTMYYEIRIHRGVPADGPDADANGPQPHVRFGWSRREAPLDAPVGFDGYSYGLTDIRFETMHRSRPGKFFHPKKAKSKTAKNVPTPVVLEPQDQHVKEGDVIGVEIQLPALNLHQKVVSGVYNPAVDVGDGFDQPAPYLEPGSELSDVVRDRIPVSYKSNMYFEVVDYASTKPIEMYSDRTANLSTIAQLASLGAPSKDSIKATPNPNHEQPQLRTLPHSAIRVYKNGKLIGTAFENLLAFLPPASSPQKQPGTREEPLDDGMVGYFPAVSCFFGGIAEVNFGDGPQGFWAPPAHIRSADSIKSAPPQNGGPDIDMPDAGVDASGQKKGWNPGRHPRGIGERFKEQIAEDIVWDIVDEVDFYMQDGGHDGKVGSGILHGLTAGRLKDT